MIRHRWSLAVVTLAALCAQRATAQSLGNLIAANPSLADDLIIYLPFDEGAGTTVNDASGNGFHGLITNQTDNYGPSGGNFNKTSTNPSQLWTAGRFGTAFRPYDAEYPHNNGQNYGGVKSMSVHLLPENSYGNSSPGGNGLARTYSLWVRRPTDRNAGWASSWVNEWDLRDYATYGVDPANEFSVTWQTTDGNVTALDYTTMETRYGNDLGGNDRQLEMPQSGGGANTRWNTAQFNRDPVTGNGDGQWHNIIITSLGDPNNNSGSIRFTNNLYIDGAFVASFATSGQGWGHHRTEAITVALPQGPKGIDINDEIDDLAIWHRILTPAEIQRIAIPEPASGLLLLVGIAALRARRRR
ncbi:MAG TPA: PEP-CTERM sorting domain-containing protein [Lacipirellulaceae bacterium]|nr:PEP-CTERM sorting domain-containing protein [Lacipirellulaceae bacterium]